MAITFDSVIQQILNELGAVLGSNPAQADSNFTAPPSTSTVIGPDFVPAHAQPALAATIGEIVEAIASTPKHPERQRFADVTASLANQDPIPELGSGGDRIIGIPGFVRDASDDEACLPAPLDAIRGYNRFPAIYGDADSYLYAINGNRIEHTRTEVLMEVCVFTRPTAFTGDIALDDWHEGGLVAGSVAKLALKESMFRDLYEAANTAWVAHLGKIQSYGDAGLYGKAQSAPSST
jgi:hypothetical protein